MRGVGGVRDAAGALVLFKWSGVKGCSRLRPLEPFE